jgi:hypothetical protein
MNYYYLNSTGNAEGPVTTSELSMMKSSGVLSYSSLVCEEGGKEWVELHTIFSPNSPSQSDKVASPSDDQKSTPTSKTPSNPKGTRIQLTIIIIILLAGVGFPAFNFLKPIPKWEYQVKTFYTAQNNDRQGSGASSYSSINIDKSVLNRMGEDGWEVVGTYLEMETAFPNFGNDQYITGIRENIRPQSLVVIFKRLLK